MTTYPRTIALRWTALLAAGAFTLAAAVAAPAAALQAGSEGDHCLTAGSQQTVASDDARLEISGGDAHLDTSGGDARLETSGGDAGMDTSGGDARLDTSGGDARLEAGPAEGGRALVADPRTMCVVGG